MGKLIHNKKSLFLIVVAISLLGFSFAYSLQKIVMSPTNKVQGVAVASDADITFTGADLNFTLLNAYPISDATGLTLEPYSFSVKSNETSKNVVYSIYMETKEGQNNIINDSNIKYSYDETSHILGDGEVRKPSLDGFTKSSKIISRTLKPGEIHNYDLRLWLSEDASTSDALNKEWSGKLVILYAYAPVPDPVSFATDSWETIKVAAETGNTDLYKIGDVKCVPLTGFTHTGDNGNGCIAENEFAVRLVNKEECTYGEESESACGFVLEFADVITEHKMNPSETLNGKDYFVGWNIRGWPASNMYSYVNKVGGRSSTGTIFKALPVDLQNIIIPTHVVSGHGSSDSNSKRQDGNWESDDLLYLLSLVEIYGNNPAPTNTSDNAVSRQLKYYAGGYELNGEETSQITTNNYGSSNKNTPIKKRNGTADYWWLRSASSNYDNCFRSVTNVGNYFFSNASQSLGVAPAFRIAGSPVTTEPKESKGFKEDSWETIAYNVKHGFTDTYNIGDVKCVALDGFTHTGDNGNGCSASNEFAVRIANKDACPAGLDSESACGFVLEFADIITGYNMNPAGELNGTQYNRGWNIGGWPASSMYSYVNEVDGNSSSGTIFKALPSDLQEVIIPTHVVSGHGSGDSNASRTDGNWESDDLLYLLSPVEVYGNNPAPTDTSDNAVSRQLKYYAGGYELNDEEINQITTANYGNTNKNTPIKKKNGTTGTSLMRSATSSTNKSFHNVNTPGSYGSGNAYNNGGVAPAFRIG